MESTGRLERVEHSPRWRWLTVMLAGMLMISLVTVPGLQAQESTEAPETPDVVIPGTGDESDASPPEETPADVTPEATVAETPAEVTSSASGSGIAISATDPGFPAVIAHGLAFLTGDQSVWQVREVTPDGDGTATAETTNAAFVYQVEGTSIIRNEVTGKRALLDPGEAFFKSGGDAYTTIADSADSLVWIFEVVGPNDVATDAFYESPLIDDYAEGVFDLEMIRFVLKAGETATVPDHTGPALVMSTNGDIDVESSGLGLLATGDGQLIIEDATVTNNSSATAEFVLVGFGAEVGDSTASAGETTATDATTEAAADSSSTTDDTTTPDPEATDEATEDTSSEDTGGTGETSINVTAQADLYVVVVADGVTVFDGPIPDGGQSGVIVGSTFEVYTSYGAATLFTNSCGEDFFMGYEEGEANYTLVANSESCAP